jgi:hypothetical protein
VHCELWSNKLQAFQLQAYKSTNIHWIATCTIPYLCDFVFKSFELWRLCEIGLWCTQVHNKHWTMIVNIGKFMCAMDNECGNWKGIKQVAQVDGLITSLVSSYMCILKYIFLKLV